MRIVVSKHRVELVMSMRERAQLFANGRWKAGLAAATRDGTRHLFAVDVDGLAAVRSYLDDFWPTKLAALKSAIESRESDDRG